MGIAPKGATRLQRLLDDIAASLETAAARVLGLLDEAGITSSVPAEIRGVSRTSGAASDDLGWQIRAAENGSGGSGSTKSVRTATCCRRRCRSNQARAGPSVVRRRCAHRSSLPGPWVVRCRRCPAAAAGTAAGPSARAARMWPWRHRRHRAVDRGGEPLARRQATPAQAASRARWFRQRCTGCRRDSSPRCGRGRTSNNWRPTFGGASSAARRSKPSVARKRSTGAGSPKRSNSSARPRRS